MNANLITILFGLVLGAMLTFLIMYGVDVRFGIGISLKWYVGFGILGATASLFIGQKTLNGDEKGVLSYLENYTGIAASPGLYWQLPGIIGIKSIEAKTLTIPIKISNPKLQDINTLDAVEGELQFVITDVFKAGLVEDVKKSAESLGKSVLRKFLAQRTIENVETVATDFLDELEGSGLKQNLDNEAAQLGGRVASFFLSEIKVPPELAKARNQKAVEKAQSEAQSIERALRNSIIAAEMAKGATYAQAQNEANVLTGKNTTLTTTEITGSGPQNAGGGGPQPIVVLNQNGTPSQGNAT